MAKATLLTLGALAPPISAENGSSSRRP